MTSLYDTCSVKVLSFGGEEPQEKTTKGSSGLLFLFTETSAFCFVSLCFKDLLVNTLPVLKRNEKRQRDNENER